MERSVNAEGRRHWQPGLSSERRIVARTDHETTKINNAHSGSQRHYPARRIRPGRSRHRRRRDQAMALEAGQKSKFWSVHESYQKEKTGLWDHRSAKIKKYASNYEKTTDATAD